MTDRQKNILFLVFQLFSDRIFTSFVKLLVIFTEIKHYFELLLFYVRNLYRSNQKLVIKFQLSYVADEVDDGDEVVGVNFLLPSTRVSSLANILTISSNCLDDMWTFSRPTISIT